MITKTVIRKGEYYDSVKLMLVSRELAAMEGIAEAAVQMGTPLNKEVLKRLDLFEPAVEGASADDLMVSIKGTEEAVATALRRLDELLEERRAGDGEGEYEYRPRTVDAAVRAAPGLNFAIVSVPGRYAKNEAMKALEKGMHVLLFSDNVTVEEEQELKRFAAANGLLLMGPDCGTAVINNVPLGFANKVRKGSIGIVGAAGTGMQEIMTLIHKYGAGISQAIGTGGRDLSEAIGGATMLQGLAALNQDPETQVIVVVSKPPAPAIAERILNYIRERCKKPAVVDFIGGGLPERFYLKGSTAAGATFAATLEEAARRAAELVGGGKTSGAFCPAEEELDKIAASEAQKYAAPQKYLRGLYSGGTLCYESMHILKGYVGDVFSNTPFNKELKLAATAASIRHTCLDLGDDAFTVGRAHPMLDTTLREQLFAREASDPEVAVILLDIVLGYGVHSDPAGVFAALAEKYRAKAAAQGRHLTIIASVCGTAEDPQDAPAQEQKLRDAGVLVMPCNAAAARLAGKIAALLNSNLPCPAIEAANSGAINAIFGRELKVLNIGLEQFAADLKSQGIECLHLDWRPPAQGDQEAVDLLKLLLE